MNPALDYSQVFNKSAMAYGANKFAPPGGVGGLFSKPFGVPQGQSMTSQVQGSEEQKKFMDTMQQQNRWLQQQLTAAQRGAGGAPAAGGPAGSSGATVLQGVSNAIKRISGRVSRLKFASDDLARIMLTKQAQGPWIKFLSAVGGRRGDAVDRFVRPGGGWEAALASAGDTGIPAAAPLARAMRSTSMGTNKAYAGDWAGARSHVAPALSSLANYGLQGYLLGRAPSLAGSTSGALRAIPGAALNATAFEAGARDTVGQAREALRPASAPQVPSFSWRRLLEFVFSLITGSRRSGQIPSAIPGGGS